MKEEDRSYLPLLEYEAMETVVNEEPHLEETINCEVMNLDYDGYIETCG